MSGLRTILIANRGEIALRIERTSRALGYRTVAVYSLPDQRGPWVERADLAVALPGASPRESYLNVEAILAAARCAGADAIHPGYGFLSENASFARRCAEEGLLFIGPPPDAIALMGDKAAAKRRMLEAGVPCVPGAQPPEQTPAALAAAAERVGFPLLVKAVAGGGGRGMRIVRTPGELASALTAARREAENAFGRGDLMLERLIEGARHVEVQIFADAHGHVVHLGERECSVQRRHQKIVEEAPSPVVGPALRDRMGHAAVAAAQAIGYVGAGTVEFLLAPDGAFSFIEMNTRLQVEHPVTEWVTGLDLVEWQLRVAAGEPLPLRQEEISFQGHAIEARLNAEDPYAGFLPQSGPVLRWLPPDRPGVRIDSGLAERLEIPPYYDPLVAKVIAHGPTREIARRRLVAALEDTVLLGPATNRRFLVELLGSPEFEAAAVVTDTLDARHGATPPQRPASAPWLWAVGAFIHLLPAEGEPEAWSNTGPAAFTLTLAEDGEGGPRELRLRWSLERMDVTVGDTTHAIRLLRRSPPARSAELQRGPGENPPRSAGLQLGILGSTEALRVELDGVAFDLHAARSGARTLVHARGLEARFEEPAPAAASEATSRTAGQGTVRAPMSGRVLSVPVRTGQRVAKGDLLAVLEAMKMEHRLLAPYDGLLRELRVAPGEQVPARAVVAVLASAADGAEGGT